MSTFDFTPGPKPGRRPSGTVPEEESGGVSCRSLGMLFLGFLLIGSAVFFFVSAGGLFGESDFASLVIDLAIAALLISIPVCYVGCVLLVTDTRPSTDQRQTSSTTGQPTLLPSGTLKGSSESDKRRHRTGFGFCMLFLFLVTVVVFGITIIVDLGGADGNGALVVGVVIMGLGALIALCCTVCVCTGREDAPVLD